MAQTDDIPRFKGEESTEEAEKWLEIFVANTGNFNDSGIFRLIRRKFPSGCSSRHWFEGLDEAARTSWDVFEAKFCDRWVARNESEGWQRFKQHLINEDMIFQDGTSPETAQQVISLWADDHLVVGRSLDCTDEALVTETKRILPPFIRAYLEAFVGVAPQNFEDLCRAIKDIPHQVISFEHLRRRISSDDWRLNMERRMGEILEKVDRLIMNTGQNHMHSGHVPHASSSLEQESRLTSHLDSDNMSSTEILSWEPSSPLTSVLSRNDMSRISSGPSTPTAEPLTLTHSLQDFTGVEITLLPHDDPAYRIPSTWRKPACVKTRDEMILITQQAIDFIMNYGQNFNVKVCQRRTFKSAISIRDRLIQGQRHKNDWPMGESGNEQLYDHLFAGLLHIHSYYAYQSHYYMSNAMWYWSDYAESSDATKNILKPTSSMISVSGGTCHFHVNALGVPSLTGGLFAPNLDVNNVLISSAKTVQLMTLSSYLAESSGDKKYLETALLTANCIKRWMIDSTTTLIKDCLVDASSAQERDGSVLSCHLTGLAIEGFAVLACVARDDEWRSLTIDIARSAMRHDEWHSSAGILTLCSNTAASDDTNVRTLRGLLIRGLMVAYERNRSNEPFCNLVRSYVNVQLNALFELARVQSSYGVDWRGPYVGPLGHGQVAALDTLVAAIGVNDV
ncbi:hypothetical protein FRC03_002048 [Tulasnella sp. 419]|nr:hypothetical protein FRC03_002048 [Tulasnella sp. 419]